METLKKLFENYFGEPLKTTEAIPGSGSNRFYVRLIGEKKLLHWYPRRIDR